MQNKIILLLRNFKGIQSVSFSRANGKTYLDEIEKYLKILLIKQRKQIYIVCNGKTFGTFIRRSKENWDIGLKKRTGLRGNISVIRSNTAMAK